MSMFLGPIHHWLYNKIRIAAARSLAIEEALSGSYSKDAASIMAEVDDIYPPFPQDVDLEDIIGDAPIHGFLNGLIRMVEMREGAIIKTFLRTCGDGVKEVAVKAAAEHGRLTGEAARGEVEQGSFESLFKALGDRRLEGMPCDEGGQPEVEGQRLNISHSKCLHHYNWYGSGAPIDTMCRITGAWIEGFIKGAAPDVSYSMEESIADGAKECRYSITAA